MRGSSTVRLPADVAQRLDRIAELDQVPRTVIIREAMDLIDAYRYTKAGKLLTQRQAAARQRTARLRLSRKTA